MPTLKRCAADCFQCQSGVCKSQLRFDCFWGVVLDERAAKHDWLHRSLVQAGVQTPMFSLHKVYSRSQINAVVGGSIRSHLPMVEGTIVAACLSLILNPKAPDVIFVSAKEDEAGQILAAQNEAVPMFVKMAPGRWAFRGYYQSYQSSKLPGVIEKHTVGSRSSGVIRVILMRFVGRSL